MVQEYVQLITKVMSGKLALSPEASALITTQGLFKALEHTQTYYRVAKMHVCAFPRGERFDK